MMFLYFAAILGISAVNSAGLSGDGITTRYWDCCKPSCAWKENLPSSVKSPVASCAADGVKVLNASVQSSCVGGTSYMCNNQQPWSVNDTFAYGFAAGSFSGGADVNHCCSCFLLTFKDQIVGKKMIVQVTNTGGDLAQSQFDIALPGGGVGIFTQGCVSQWNAPQSGWGEQYGGVSSLEECSQLPTDLQDGCKFRFNWYNNANNPQVTYEEVDCPTEITEKSGCM